MSLITNWYDGEIDKEINEICKNKDSNDEIGELLFELADNYEDYKEMSNNDTIKEIVGYKVNNEVDKLKLIYKVCDRLLDIIGEHELY